MKKNKSLLVPIISIFALSNVFAQNIDHFYGGVGGGLGRARIDDVRISNQLIDGGATSTSIANNRNDAAYKIFGGYQFTSFFAVEGGYFKLGEFGFSSSTVPAGTLNGNIKLQGVNLDLVGTLPISDRFSLIGRVGIDSISAKDSFTRSGSVLISNPNPQVREQNYKAGVGFSYLINQSVSLRGEFERYRVNDAVGNKGDINVGTLSLVFPFGQTSKEEPKVVERVVYEIAPVIVVATVEPTPIVQEEPPTPIPVSLPPEHLHVSFNSDVLFGFDRSIVTPDGKTELDNFSSQLNGVEYDAVTIVGHTDRIGSKVYNDRLSLQRADSVKAYFISRGTIPEQKIKTIGKGSSEPLTDVGACKGMYSSLEAIACLAPDRRVEVDVVGMKLKED